MKKVCNIAIRYDKALKSSANSKFSIPLFWSRKKTFFVQNVLASLLSSCLQSSCLFFGSLGCPSRFAQLLSVKWYLCHSCQIFDAIVWLSFHCTTCQIFYLFLAAEELGWCATFLRDRCVLCPFFSLFDAARIM